MTVYSSHHARPTGQAYDQAGIRKWLLTGLIALAPAILLGPAAEAVESPLALHVGATEASHEASVAPALEDLIRATRARRTLVARQLEGLNPPVTNAMAALDEPIRAAMKDLEQNAKVLPVSMAQEIEDIQQQWTKLEAATHSPHNKAAKLFALHSLFIDQQLALLSHVRKSLH